MQVCSLGLVAQVLDGGRGSLTHVVSVAVGDPNIHGWHVVVVGFPENKNDFSANL